MSIQFVHAEPRQMEFTPTLRVGLDQTTLIDPKGTLLSWGNNFYNQIRLPNVANANEPISCIPFGSYLQLTVSGRSGHSLAMDRQGQWVGMGE